jgi:hypothetical protein
MASFSSLALRAQDVLEVSLDLQVIKEIRNYLSRPMRSGDFSIVKPPWNSDIKWLAPATVSSFRFFDQCFRRLGVVEHVAPFLDLNRAPVMYCPFLVVRKICREAHFHSDWLDVGNQAFTLITPLSKNASELGLVYHQYDGSVAEYTYREGQGVIFGDNFVHSTKPGVATRDIYLLSFTFGTDKMKYWKAMSRTAGYQSELFRLPNGLFYIRGL